jgi:hypothetical protein
VPVAEVALPDGKKARIEFTDRAQLDATVDDLVKAHAKPGGTAQPTAPAAPRSSLDRARELTAPNALERGLASAVGEPALEAATGLAASAAGGIAGLARGAGAGAAALATGRSPGEALDVGASEFTNTLHAVQAAGTRTPQTQTGKAVSETIKRPFTWLAGKGVQAATAVGGATERTAEALGASRETARRLGGGAAALTETAVQAAPAVVGKVAGRMGVGDEALAARTAQVGEVPRGTSAKPEGPDRPGEAPGTGQPPPPGSAGAARPGEPAAANSPEGRAQAYAVRIGLDWSRLGAGTRAALTQIARDARALDRLDPAAVQRLAHLQSLRIPVGATRGQLTRDPVQLRREALASNVAEGQPIRDVDIAANRDLQANLEALRGRAAAQRGGLHEPVTPEGTPAATPSLRAPTKLPTQVGSSVQTALRSAERASKSRYDALYKRAREIEPTAKVSSAPLTELLGSNPDIQHLGFVAGWLNRAAKARGITEGQPYTPTEFTLNELHDLRAQATKIARTGGVEGHYAGEVVKAIDGMMEGAPEAAKAWRTANAAFRQHKAEFADQKLVRDLVSQKKGTAADRALALEKTWSTVARGNRADLLAVKASLLKAGKAGRQAWNDLRGETVNRILEDARNVTARDETERAVLTEAALRKAVNSIPRENLRELLGANLLRELDAIVRARSITTRSPVGGRTTQSGTVPNLLVTWAHKAADAIPGGSFLSGAVRGVVKLRELGESARTARRATEVKMEDLQRGGGSLGQPTIGEALPQQQPPRPPP